MKRHDRPLSLYSVDRTGPDAEGSKGFQMTLRSSLPGDVQDIGANTYKLAYYGLDETDSGSKLIFVDDTADVSAGMVVCDNSEGTYYEVRGVNCWPGHKELVSVPWSGAT